MSYVGDAFVEAIERPEPPAPTEIWFERASALGYRWTEE